MKNFDRMAIALGLTLLFVNAASAFAAQSPAARTCRIAGGLPWVIALADDDLELCRFGRAAISSFAFYQATVLEEQPLAVGALLHSEPCMGETFEGKDSDGVVFTVCRFDDGSAIELGTLQRGPKDLDNRELVQRLVKR